VVAYPAAAIGNVSSAPHALNTGLVFRDTALPGGFWLGNSTSDVVVEGSNISWGGGECIVTGAGEERFLERNNACEA
jgi:hypothetical protein